MVLGFGGPTKGIMIIWVHFVILVGCELVTFKPQIMLNDHVFNFYYFLDNIFENVAGKSPPLKPTVHVNYDWMARR